MLRRGGKSEKQQAFEFRTWGGARPGAGRKPAAGNEGLLPHRERPTFSRHVPVHVTMRAGRGVPRLRAQVVAPVVVGELARASSKGFRVLHFSVQGDHVHLIAEADDGEKLSRGMQRLASRIAMAVNALASRHGRFWRERYHRRDLATPRQFRNALVYVTFNARKHAAPGERPAWANALDRWSSAIWLDEWRAENGRERLQERLLEHRARAGPRPTALPKTWLARVGWKRHGLIDFRESPRSPA